MRTRKGNVFPANRREQRQQPQIDQAGKERGKGSLDEGRGPEERAVSTKGSEPYFCSNDILKSCQPEYIYPIFLFSLTGPII
jgi:hypothetical protein